VRGRVSEKKTKKYVDTEQSFKMDTQIIHPWRSSLTLAITVLCPVSIVLAPLPGCIHQHLACAGSTLPTTTLYHFESRLSPSYDFIHDRAVCSPRKFCGCGCLWPPLMLVLACCLRDLILRCARHFHYDFLFLLASTTPQALSSA
jgi:hypothetical protein